MEAALENKLCRNDDVPAQCRDKGWSCSSSLLRWVLDGSSPGPFVFALVRRFSGATLLESSLGAGKCRRSRLFLDLAEAYAKGVLPVV